MRTEPSRPEPNPAEHQLVIEPRKGWIAIDWAEMYRFRELLYFLVWRDVKVRYKQTVMGVAWAILQPLFNTLLFTLLFGKFGRLPTDGMDAMVFYYSGMLLWLFFSSGVNSSSQSLISQAHLLTKVYFPRLFVPTATIGVSMVDLALASIVFVGVVAFHGAWPDWTIVYLPLLLLIMIIGTLGTGYLVAALTVTYRDFRYIIPFVLQLMMFISVPVPMGQVPEKYRWLLGLNPMAGPIDGLRAMIRGYWYPDVLAVSSVMSVLLFVVGIFYFRKTERRFADIA
jgi:lipopolysaccharide transport system permease protein